ncbi:MAG: hypothetical protein NWF08_08370 [Candidatus Bathyarchaeota archaeon]|nr:hypothetical protein [Candidatus Bathyarchaeota archaeon]
MKKYSSMISGLDDILDGGFPRPSSIGIIGEVGSGKSLLCWNLMINALKQEYNVLYYLTEESKEEMKENILQYGWDIDDYENKGNLKVVDIFSKGVDLARESLMEPEALMKESFNFFEILKEGRNYYFGAIRGKDLVVFFDSLSTIFLAMETKKALAFLQNLKMATRVARCVGIATLHTKVHDEIIENICKTNADGIIQLSSIEKEKELEYYLRILKMSRSNFYQGIVNYRTSDKGVAFTKVKI